MTFSFDFSRFNAHRSIVTDFALCRRHMWLCCQREAVSYHTTECGKWQVVGGKCVHRGLPAGACTLAEAREQLADTLPPFSTGAIGVAGTVDLLMARDGDRISMGFGGRTAYQ